LSRQQSDTAFPVGRIDPPHLWPAPNPTQGDYERAKDKARQLLRQIVPESSWREFENKGMLQIIGQRGCYVIYPCSQTEIRDLKSGQCVAFACLQLSISAPTYDRMVAEYLLIKNAEDVYWKTANIFLRTGNEFEIATLFLIAFDIALSVNLLIEVLRYGVTK